MLEKKLLLFSAIFSIILLSGCISQGNNFSEYEESTFSIKYQSNWKQSSTPNFNVVFLAPEKNDFSANFGVSLERVSEPFTIEEIAESAKQSQMMSYPQYKILSENTITINGKSAFKRIYTWSDDEYNLDITQIQVLLKDGSDLYSFTATSLTSNFQTYEPAFTEMINSFQLK